MLVSVGIAMAAALLLGVRGGGAVTQQRTIGYTLARLPAQERAFRVTWGGLAAETSYRRVSATAEGALNGLSASRPVAAVLLRQSTFGGGLIQLAAIADLPGWARATRGRLPRGPCTPRRCEVLQVGTPGPALVHAAGLHFVTVGHGTLTSALPLGSASPPAAAGPTAEAHYTAAQAPPPYLITRDVPGFAALPALHLIYRTYQWSAPIPTDAVHAWDIDPLLSREAAADAALKAHGYQYDLTAPDQALLSAQEAGRVSQRRLLLIGGGAAALLLGFVLVGGGAFRRSLGAEWDRLQERGARAWQLWLFATAESAAAAALGVVGGIVAGVVATTWATRATGLDSATLLRHSVITATGAGLALVSWIVGTIVLLAAARVPIDGDVGRVGMLDLVGLGALGALLLAAARGQVSASGLGTAADPLIPLLPVLLAVGVLAVTVRLLPLLARLGERLTRRRSVTLRLALVALARRPQPASVTAALVAVSLGLGLFAVTYRSTLTEAQRDQAAYEVPLDYTLTEGAALVLPLQAAPLERYRGLAGGVGAYPVLRRSATVTARGTQSVAVTLLGVSPAAIPRLNGWRADFASSSQSQIATRLAVGGAEAHLRGAALPLDARRVSVDASVRGDPIQLAVVVAQRRGGFASIPLGTLASGEHRGLTATIPSAARGGGVVGLRVAPTRVAQETLESVGGHLHIGPLTAPAEPSAVVTDWQGWIGQGGLQPTATTHGVSIRYAVSGQASALFRPVQPTDRRLLPVVVSADIAAGIDRKQAITLTVGDQQLRGRIVATAQLFPTTQDTDSEFVLVDQRQLAVALNSTAPGVGIPDEVWLGLRSQRQAPAVERALRRPPFDTLQVASRRAIQARLRADPLSEGIVVLLAVAAVLALASAVVGILVATGASMRDDRAELLDLEAQGVDPRALRRYLRLRAGLVAGLGAVGAVLVGAVLAQTVIDLVRVSANATAPQPPLSVSFDLPTSAIALLGYATVASAVITLATRGWFRRSTLQPGEEMEP